MTYSSIEDAFLFVSSAAQFEHSAVVHRITGETFFASDYSDDFEFPGDEDDNNYISIPHKNDLKLGKPLVMEFVQNHCPELTKCVVAIFSRRGAYGRYKELLVEKGLLEEWYTFENARTKEALLEWCAENGLVIETNV
jgi:Uncharacterised protein family (UPF0158)